MGGFSTITRDYDGMANRIVNGSFLVDQIAEGTGYLNLGNGVHRLFDGWSAVIAGATIADASVTRNLTANGQYEIVAQSPSDIIVPGEYMLLTHIVEGTMLDIFSPSILTPGMARLEFDAMYGDGVHVFGIPQKLGVAMTNIDDQSIWVTTVDIVDSGFTRCGIQFPMGGIALAMSPDSRNGQLRIDFMVMVSTGFSAPISWHETWRPNPGPNPFLCDNYTQPAFSSFFVYDQLRLRNVQLTLDGGTRVIANRPFSQELEICKRYYQKSFPFGVPVSQGAGFPGVSGYRVITAGIGVDSGNIREHLSPEMRSTPLVIGYNPVNANGNWYNSFKNSDSAAAISAVSSNSTNQAGLVNNQVAGDGVGDVIICHWTANARLS